VAYAAQTISTAHTGSEPSAGPVTAGVFGSGGPGGITRSGTGAPGAGAGGLGGLGGTTRTSAALVSALKAGNYRWAAAVSGSKTAASLELAAGGTPVMAIGGFDGQGGNITLAQFKAYVAQGDIHYYLAGTGGPGGGGGGAAPGARPTGGPSGMPGDAGFPGRGGGGTGFPGGGARGGFAGRAGGAGAGGAVGGDSASAITTWVKAHFKAVTIGGQTVYDLTQPLG
jgi:hypothetical protein